MYDTMELKASFTVEASFVMGIVLILYLSVIAYAGYLHDRTVLSDMSLYYKEVLQHMREEPVSVEGYLETTRLEEQNVLRLNGYGNAEQGSVVEARFAESAGERLLFSRISSVHVSIGDEESALTYEAEYALGVGRVIREIAGIEDRFTGTVRTEKRMDPEEFIRMMRGIVWRGSQ